ADGEVAPEFVRDPAEPLVDLTGELCHLSSARAFPFGRGYPPVRFGRAGTVPIRHYVELVITEADNNDLLPLLRRRLHGMYSPLLAGTHASLLFTAGGMANWTVEIEDGRASARRGGPPRPTTTVRAALPVLTDVVSGARSGVQAFLDGALTVRGNLALALEL